MEKTTVIVLDDHAARFVDQQVGTGLYGSASDVVQAALKLLEEHGQDMLRQALIDGENSGDAGSLTMQDIMRAARDEAIQKATMG